MGLLSFKFNLKKIYKDKFERKNECFSTNQITRYM